MCVVQSLTELYVLCMLTFRHVELRMVQLWKYQMLGLYFDKLLYNVISMKFQWILRITWTVGYKRRYTTCNVQVDVFITQSR